MLKRAFFLFVLTLLTLGPAQAAWKKLCQPDGSCQVSSQTKISDDAFSVGVTRYSPSDGMNQDALTIVFPKISESMGMRFTIDNTLEFAFDAGNCTGTVCAYTVLLPPDDGAGLLKRGSLMRLFVSDGGAEETFDVSLSGFTRAYDADLAVPVDTYIQSEFFGPEQAAVVSPLLEASKASAVAPTEPVIDPAEPVAVGPAEPAPLAADGPEPAPAALPVNYAYSHGLLESLVTLQHQIAGHEAELLDICIRNAGLAASIKALPRALTGSVDEQADALRDTELTLAVSMVDGPRPDGNTRSRALNAALAAIVALGELAQGDAEFTALTDTLLENTQRAMVVSELLGRAKNEANGIVLVVKAEEARLVRAADSN